VKRSLVDSEIFHAVKAENVELGARTLKQIIFVCNCFFFCSTLFAIAYTCFVHSFPLAIHC